MSTRWISRAEPGIGTLRQTHRAIVRVKVIGTRAADYHLGQSHYGASTGRTHDRTSFGDRLKHFSLAATGPFTHAPTGGAATTRVTAADPLSTTATPNSFTLPSH
jgi:hypothetical protein